MDLILDNTSFQPLSVLPKGPRDPTSDTMVGQLMMYSEVPTLLQLEQDILEVSCRSLILLNASKKDPQSLHL